MVRTDSAGANSQIGYSSAKDVITINPEGRG